MSLRPTSLSSLLAVLAATLLSAQALPPSKVVDPVPPARITLTTPFPVHLGSVGPKAVQDAVFGIKSIHDRPFHLRVMDLSLGLSLDEAQLKEALQPGEVQMVHVRVNPNDMLGYVRGAVRLGTDDPSQPFYILRYDMIVRPELAVDADRKSLGDVAPYESPVAIFHFKREGDEPVRLDLASPLPAYLEAEIIPHGPVADLRMVLRATRLPAGATAGLEVLKVATNAPKQPLFTLYLDWRLALPVLPTPSRLVFDDLKTTLLGLVLKAKDGKPFRIQSVEIQGRGFELLDRPGPAAERQVLRVRRTGKIPSAMLVLRFVGVDEPLKVPLQFLDPRAKGPNQAQISAPDTSHHH